MNELSQLDISAITQIGQKLIDGYQAEQKRNEEETVKIGQALVMLTGKKLGVAEFYKQMVDVINVAQKAGELNDGQGQASDQSGGASEEAQSASPAAK